MNNLPESLSRNDASFMMSDAYSGGEANVVVTAEAQWRRFLGRNVQVESKARPAEFWAASGDASSAGGFDSVLQRNGDVFRMVEGLAGGNTVSFESASRPGYYVCNRGGVIRIERIDFNTAE